MANVEDCHTPTELNGIEFKFGPPPIGITETYRSNESQNLMVNRITARCYTPIVDFRSPGLSPICDLVDKINETTGESHDNSKLSDMANNNDRQQRQQKQQQHQQQQQQQQNDINNGSLDWNTSLSVRYDHDSSNNQSSKSFDSALIMSQILNHTWNTGWLINKVGLGEYAEIFEKEIPDFDTFLNIKPEDLDLMGIRSERERKIIAELVKELNSV